MKKILNILLLVTSLNVFAQEVKTTRTGGYFYCQCSDGHTTIKRSTFTLADGDGKNYTIKNNGVTCVIKSPDHTITAKGFDTKITFHFKDTVFRVLPIAPVVKKDNDLQVISVVSDEDLNIYKFVEKFYNQLPYDVNIRKYYSKVAEKKYLDSIIKHKLQPTRFFKDTVLSISSKYMRRQCFFTKHWLFSMRESNKLDSLKTVKFSDFGHTPGSQFFLVGKDTLWTRRNTYTSRKRYSQVRALDTTFNKIIELPIRKNNLFKE